MKKYNPWENSKTFIQETGSLTNFIDFLERNNITSSDTQESNSENTEINNTLSYNEELALFETLNSISKQYYEVSIT